MLICKDSATCPQVRGCFHARRHTAAKCREGGSSNLEVTECPTCHVCKHALPNRCTISPAPCIHCIDEQELINDMKEAAHEESSTEKSHEGVH